MQASIVFLPCSVHVMNALHGLQTMQLNNVRKSLLNGPDAFSEGSVVLFNFIANSSNCQVGNGKSVSTTTDTHAHTHIQPHGHKLGIMKCRKLT